MNEQNNLYISIIIPVYNAEKYLGECIDSVLTQSFRDFELILVDDGSKDSSGEICDEYAKKDERIRMIHQPNGGVTSARKAGVEAALAEWIMFVDADDKVTTDGLLRLVEEQQKDPELDIIEGSYQWFYPDGTTKVRPNIALENGHTYYNGHDYALSLCQEGGVSRGPWSKIIRKDILVKSYALNIPRWISNREDTMMLTIAAKSIRKHVLLADGVYLYRQQFGESAIGNKKSLDYWSDYLKYFEEKAIKDTDGDWEDVFHMTIINVFGMIVHGGNIKTGYMPLYFKQTILSILRKHQVDLHQVDMVYVRILGLTSIIRYPICIVLHALFVIKRSVFGKYFALKSRK